MNLALLIFVGGVLHLGILLASVQVPKVLDWRTALKPLDPLSRQLIWVHGIFGALVIFGFGLVSLLFSADLASGSALARAVSGFIACFWAARLFIQFFIFRAEPHLKSVFLRAGYYGLTVVFIYHTI